jgi:hypothetical protein
MALTGRLALAALAAGALPFAGADPAAAVSGSDSFDDTIGIRFNSNGFTCHVFGLSDYEFPVVDDLTAITASVFDNSSEPACAGLLHQAEVEISYEQPVGSGQIHVARASGAINSDIGVSTTVYTHGPTGPIQVLHRLTYDCVVGGQPEPCVFAWTTRPK